MSLKEKLLELIKFEDQELPPALKSKSTSYYILGAGFLAVGVAFGIAYKSFRIMGLPVIGGLAMVLLGMTFKLSIQYTGYVTKTGRCIDYDNRFTTLFKERRKGADYFILETPDEVIKVPVTKRKAAPPLDSFVEIYVSKVATKYNSDGYVMYTNVYGHSVVAEGEINEAYSEERG